MSDTPDLAISIGVNQAALAKSLAQMEKRITDAAKSVEKKATFKFGGKSAEDSAKAMEREMDALRMKFDPLFAKSKAYEAKLNDLTRAHKVGAIGAKQYQAALDALNDEFAQVGSMAGGAASGGMRSFGSAAQQIGYQVGDFAVQVGAGTSALQAFGQQAPQLLGAFGMWGAIAGAIVAIGAPLARTFLDVEEKADPLSKTMGELERATSEYASAAEAARQPIADLRKEYGDMADDVERSLKAQAEFAAAKSRNALADAKAAVTGAFGPVSGALGENAAAVAGAYGLAVQLGTTIGNAQEVAKAIDAINKAADFAEAQKAAEQLNKALVKIAGSEDEAARRFGGEDGIMPAVETYLKMMRDHIKAAGDELKSFATMAQNAATAVAAVEARGFGKYGTFGTGMDAAKEMIKAKEGFSSTAYWDVNHYRAGYGSDTATRADGSTYSIQQGMSVSLDEAERDLERRIATYFQQIVSVIGPEAFQRLNEAQQGALASLLHNYGAGEFRAGGDLGGVVAALQAGSNQGTADAIARLGSDNGGVNRARRNDEAAAFGGASDAANDAVEAINKETEARKALDKATQEYGQSLLQAVQSGEFEASIAGKSAEDQARLRAEYLLTQQAKEKGIDLNSKIAGSELTVAEAIKQKAAADGAAAVASERRKIAEQQSAAALQVAAQAQMDFQRGIVSAIIEGNNFGDVLGNLAKRLAEAALQAALFGKISNGPGGSTSSGGLLSGLFNAVGGLFGGFFADGGMPPIGKVSVVGESGPELFVPKVPGVVVPNHVAFGGAAAPGPQITSGTLTLTDDGRIAAVISYRSQAAGAAAFSASQHAFSGNLRQLQARGG